MRISRRFQIISEGLGEQESFPELAPLKCTSCFSIKHLGALLHVKDLEVPKRDYGVNRNGSHLAKKWARGRVNLDPLLLPRGCQEGKCYWPLLLPFTLKVREHLTNVILANFCKFFPKCVELKTLRYFQCFNVFETLKHV